MGKIELGPLLGVIDYEHYVITIVCGDDLQGIELIVNEVKYASTSCTRLFHYTAFHFSISPSSAHNEYYFQHNGHKVNTGSDSELNQWSFKKISKNPKIASSSCLGTNSMSAEDWPASEYTLWEKILEEKPDLLVLCGDQVYADALGYITFNDRQLQDLFSELEHHHDPTGKVISKLDAFYEKLYIQSWTKKYMCDVLAQIPHTMNWDDHDLFDGFGSYSHKIQNGYIFQCIKSVATKYYSALQLKDQVKPLHATYNYILSLEDTLIIQCDTRSERKIDQIMNIGYKVIKDKISSLDLDKIKNLFIVLPLPIGYKKPNPFTLQLTKLLYQLPIHISIIDDSLDSWHSLYHKRDLRQMCQFLETLRNNFPQLKSYTIFSGDYHQGGLSRIKLGNSNIYQVVATPLSNRPIQGLTAFLFNLFTRNDIRFHNGHAENIIDRINKKNFAIWETGQIRFRVE
jgi:hypothetical protein